MPVDPDQLFIYRIIPIENLEQDLINGLFAKRFAAMDNQRVVMANNEIVARRDGCGVHCYPGTVVNDYVPFYFSIRTPMLFNIKTGKGVLKRAQADIVYLCVKLTDVANDQFVWCFTDGNAAIEITSFYNDLCNLNLLDWRSIKTTDFRNFNADGDNDRIRKKHAEFLVKDFVPADKVSAIVVYDKKTKKKVDKMIQNINFVVKVAVSPRDKFYFE